jgi:catechol 2,3-dioxygenase-like lactoylglutathione lyase family enzyme
VLRSFHKTFVSVREMRRSVAFYRRLGLELAAYRTAENPRAYQPLAADRLAPGEPPEGVDGWTRALFWIDRARTQCLVLSTATDERPFRRQHIAFNVDLADLRRAGEWMAERDLTPFADFGKEPTEPIVHNWLPSASFSFTDPDGHHLELSAPLPGAPLPDAHLPPKEQQPLYLSEWEQRRARLDAPTG